MRRRRRCSRWTRWRRWNKTWRCCGPPWMTPCGWSRGGADGSEEHPQPGHQADLAAVAGPGRVPATLLLQGAADCKEQGLAAARRGRQQEAPGDVCDGPGQGGLLVQKSSQNWVAYQTNGFFTKITNIKMKYWQKRLEKLKSIIIWLFPSDPIRGSVTGSSMGPMWRKITWRINKQGIQRK